jgi:alkanesulfonate monooxygenase SsuD/methylene tetrahydromethanopterin reductase-like flavin-dependent oxidoreductase (luciferase family)
MLDEGLELVTAVWSGARVEHAGEHYRVTGVRFGPTPVQQPLPVWVAAIWPAPRPLKRARRWQGVFPLGLPRPAAVPDLRAKVGDGKDIVVVADHHPAAEWERAGATWWLRDVAAGGPIGAVRQLIDAGPPRTPGAAENGPG